MIKIRPAKEIKGTVTLPPNPDYFFLTAIFSLVSEKKTTINSITTTPLLEDFLSVFNGLLNVERKNDSYIITPVINDPNIHIYLKYDTLPFMDLVVFILLGLGKILVFKDLPQKKLLYWGNLSKLYGCTIDIKTEDSQTTLFLKEKDHFSVPKTLTDPNLAHSVLGLAVGLKKQISFNINFNFHSPLRHILLEFGYLLEIKSNTILKEDPLTKRIRLMQSKKKKDNNTSYTLKADFSKSTKESITISLPGDDILAGLLIEAKVLIQRGLLTLENVPTETWNFPISSLIRKMGCKPIIKNSNNTSFGSTGVVQLQKFTPVGRKTDCTPIYQFRPQLSAMVMLSCLSKGQSIFRNLIHLRDDNPDTIELILKCVRLAGGRHGEMPDGIVIDGAKQFDGFDIDFNLSAELAGACAIAGLKCMGETSVPSRKIKHRWPGFENLLNDICEYRK